MSVEIEPVCEAIGVNVHGLDLRETLSADDRSVLLGALERHLALFIRDQSLGLEQMLDFGSSLNPLERHPFAPAESEHPELVVLDQIRPVGQGGDAWHADATFTAAPPAIGILLARVVPPVGGDTCFASAIAAFEALSPPMQRLLEKLRGVHDLTRQLSLAIEHGYFEGDLGEMQERWPPLSHPVVIRQPGTGRRGLFVNGNYTTRLEGLYAPEGEGLLAFLVEHIRSPELQCRFRWEAGSLVVWDNRFVQHFAVSDYDDRRVMWRLNVAGKPIVA
ncbi:MAG: TauD/TfdA family dioxygenase [Myxococcota bacterium]